MAGPEAVLKRLAAYLQQFKEQAEAAHIPKAVMKKIEELLEILP